MVAKAELRALADAAVAQMKPRVIREGQSGRASPLMTPPAEKVIPLLIRCACGHEATIRAKPADLIGRRLRCSACGTDPPPF